MIRARLLPDGRLADIAKRPKQFPEDVELDAMPDGFGPFMRDPTNPRRAVPHAAWIAADDAEKRSRARERLFQRKYGLLLERSSIMREPPPQSNALADVDARIAAVDAQIAAAR